MAEHTEISWADSTFNFGYGCQRISSGCLNCFITSTPPLRMRHYQHGQPFIPCSEANWKLPFKMNKKPWVCENGHTRPVSPHGDYAVCPECDAWMHRRRVFVGSLTDWLWDGIPIPTLARLLDTMRQCQDINFLMCSKRVDQWPKRKSELFWHDQQTRKPDDMAFYNWLKDWHDGKPPANVWIGTTVENNAARPRIDDLRKIPAAVRFLSCEPLLEDIDLDLGRINHDRKCNGPTAPGIDWGIIGGESHQKREKARPCNIEWIRSLVHQCRAAAVAPYVKQAGSHIIDPQAHSPYPVPDSQCWPIENGVRGDEGTCRIYTKHHKGGDMAEWPVDLRVREYPEDGR